MAYQVSIKEALELTGVSRRTLYRDMDAGRLSYEYNARDRRVFTVSELQRVYGHLNGIESPPESPPAPESTEEQHELPFEPRDVQHAPVPMIDAGKQLVPQQPPHLQVANKALQALANVTEENQKLRELVAQLVEENRQDREYMLQSMQALLDTVGADAPAKPKRQALARPDEDPHGLRALLRQITQGGNN